MNTKRKHYVMYYTMSYFRTSQKKPFLQLPFTVCTDDLFAQGDAAQIQCYVQINYQ